MIRGLRRYSLVANNPSDRRIQLTANAPGNLTGFAKNAPQTVTGTTPVGQSRTRSNKQNWDRYERDILEGFIQYDTDTFTRKIQEDMFFFDPIMGTAIEIGSTMPYSNFEISGTESKERRNQFTSSVNAMQMRDMLPKISKEMKVEGKHISSMNYDDSKNRFTSIIPYSPAWCVINPVPVFGRDPLIDVNFPDYLKNLVKSDDQDMRNEIDRYAEDLKELISKGSQRLDPEFVLYLARAPFSWSPYGVSQLRRLIPIWLFEKSLARGTIDLAGRRQKSILHLIAGDETWLPTNDQLKQLSDLFINADNDPIGAIVATRPGIDTNEVRQESGGWSWTESYDTLTQIKLKGLGYSDSIFSDFNVQAAEQTINSTLESMQAEREEVTQRVFYNKMFLTIAVKNNFRKSEKKQLVASDELKDYFNNNDYISRNSQHVMLSADDEAINPDEYDLPIIRFEKNLKVVANDALFNNLGTLAERGMPAPLRMQAAALGASFQDMLDGLEQDVVDRKIIEEYRKKLPQPEPQEGEDGGGGDGNMFMESSDTWRRIIGRDITARRKNRSMEAVVHKDTHTGKELSRRGRMDRMYGENKIILEATQRIKETQQAKERSLRKKPNKSFSYRK